MAAPSTLFVALLLGFPFPAASAIAATPAPSIVDAANDSARAQGATAILRAQMLHGCIRLTNWDALTVAAAVGASVPVVMQE